MGESSFWYRPTRVVPDQRPLNGRCITWQNRGCNLNPGPSAFESSMLTIQLLRHPAYSIIVSLYWSLFLLVLPFIRSSYWHGFGSFSTLSNTVIFCNLYSILYATHFVGAAVVCVVQKRFDLCLLDTDSYSGRPLDWRTWKCLWIWQLSGKILLGKNCLLLTSSLEPCQCWIACCRLYVTPFEGSYSLLSRFEHLAEKLWCIGTC